MEKTGDSGVLTTSSIPFYFSFFDGDASAPAGVMTVL